MKCYRHRFTSATVSCGHCDRPICSDCMVSAPAGMRCRDCSSHPVAVTGAQDTSDRLGWAISSALFVSIMGALMVKGLGFFAMVAGPCYGALAGEMLLRKIHGEQVEPGILMLPTELVVGDTTAPPGATSARD